MGDKLRLHVGGLGSSVQAYDLEKTFTSPQLGAVQSVEIIRTKGRSFAYLDFVPASDKGLAKLFNTYNGCMWRGGRLKLEKAKEDYICRLRREWVEDAQREAKLPCQDIDADESLPALSKLKKDEDIGKMQLNVFFPKLRKIKAIPFKGTGKHKYSFQRIEVPPFPTHFCDCEEHFVPPETTKKNVHSGFSYPAKRNNTDDREVDNCGVNEEELNMMKSVLDKLLVKETKSEIVLSKTEPSKKILMEKETQSEIVLRKTEPSEKIQIDASSVDKWQVDDNEEEQVSDEDDFVINIVGQSRKRAAAFEEWGQKTSIVRQDSMAFASEVDSVNITSPKIQGTKIANHTSDKKRKQCIREDKPNDTVPCKKKGRKEDSRGSTDEHDVTNTKKVVKESESVRSSREVGSSKKSPWKALVSEKGSTAFSISDILTNHESDVEAKPGSDHTTTEPCSNENTGQQDETSKPEELEKVSDVPSTKPTASEDLVARGAYWKQKSSWLQLVKDANASSFNLSQILPDATFQKQELPKFNVVDFSNTGKGKQHVSVDEKSCAEDISEPQVTANKDTCVNTTNPNEDVLTNEWNKAAPVGEQSSSSNEKVEEESSAQMLATNLVPSNRALGEIVVSETCPFMKTAASMKEWSKSKAALSGSHKKKGNEKDSLRG